MSQAAIMAFIDSTADDYKKVLQNTVDPQRGLEQQAYGGLKY